MHIVFTPVFAHKILAAIAIILLYSDSLKEQSHAFSDQLKWLVMTYLCLVSGPGGEKHIDHLSTPHEQL